MEKKLYRVKVTLYVMAEDESAACAAATGANFDIFECAARIANDVLPEWKDAIPYNADDERTCFEIVSSQAHATRQEPEVVKLPDYVEAAIQVFQHDNQSFQSG